jgi:hypothetical protein
MDPFCVTWSSLTAWLPDSRRQPAKVTSSACETTKSEALNTMAVPATQSAVISSVTASEIGKASGTFSMLRQLSGVFGIAILAAVFARVGSFSSAQAFSNGFASAIRVDAALTLVGAIAGLLLPGKGDMAFVQTTPQASETREHESYSLPIGECARLST